MHHGKHEDQGSTLILTDTAHDRANEEQLTVATSQSNPDLSVGVCDQSKTHPIQTAISS